MKKTIFLLFLLSLFLLILNCNQTKNPFIDNSKRIDTDVQKINITDTNKKLSRYLDNDKHIYELELVENQFLAIDFEQFGIDIKIEIKSPDNNNFTYNLQKGIRGKEHFIFISKTFGTYKLIISPANEEVLPGKYEMEFKNIYSATKLDFIRYQAVQNLNDVILAKYEKNKDFNDVIKILENSIENLKICKDFYHLSLTQTFMGDLNFFIGNYKKAVFFYNSAISIADEIMEPDLKIYPMNGLAFASMKENKINESIEYFKKGVEIATQIGDLLKKGYLLGQNGNIYADNYEMDLAQTLLENALTIQKNFGERRNVFLTYVELGFVCFTSAQYQKSIEMFINALNIAEKYKIEDGRVYALILLAKSHLAINDTDSAIKYVLDAHKISKGSNDNYTESLVLHELANLYGANGDTEKAQYFYKVGIEKAQFLPTIRLTILNSLADFYLRSGDLIEAKKNLDEAVKISNNKFLDLQNHIIYQKAFTNFGLGKFFLEQKNYNKAYKYLEQSLDIYTDYEISELQSEILFYMAKLFLAKKDFKEAEKNIKRSIYLRELIEESLVVQDLKLFYLTKLQDQYDLYIELLIEKWQTFKKDTDLKAALAIIEKSKMKILSQNVASHTNNVVSYQKLDNLEKNLELKKENLANSISQLRREKINLLNQVDFESQQLVRLDKKLAVLKNQHYVLEAQSKIKEKSPSFFDFQTVEKLLDEDTTIIEYHLSGKQGWAFVINKTSLTCFEIKNYSQINKIVKDIKIGLSVNQQVNIDLSEALSNILFSSINLDLLKNKLVILPSRLLNSIPWSALPIGKLKSERKFLIENYELVLVPCISVLIAQKSNSKKESENIEDILVVSDPVTERIDERLESVTLSAKIKKDANTLDSIMRGFPVDKSQDRQFSRLHFSQEEAKTITKTFQKVKNLSGFNANLAELRNFRGKRFLAFHLATHTVINPQEPELSYIVLSLFDETGNAINGYLTLADIYDLGISADIVILSSCESGIGKEIKGEGTISFGYAFISTGSSSVVSSLWKVDDKFSSIFMDVFYKYLKDDVTKPAVALRKTQIKFVNDPNWSNPFYWAAFTIQGI